MGIRVSAAIAFVFMTTALAAIAAPPGKIIRFMIPNASYSTPFHKELNRLVDEYNRFHPESTVQVLRRGDDFSSLRDFIAAHLAGDPPEIAIIESVELPAIESLHATRPIPADVIREVGFRFGGATVFELPFARTGAVLLADLDFLDSAGLLKGKHATLPTDWKGFSELVESVARVLQGSKDRHALALPLQGPRGLCLFEALAGIPLWTREAGGLRSNRNLGPPIRALQSWIDRPAVARSEEGWDHAFQDFLERKTPLLVAASDTLPYLLGQANFPWIAGPAPQADHPGASTLESGSHLVITRDTPEVSSFLKFLYAPARAAQWAAAGGFLPLGAAWEAQWKSKPELAAWRDLVSKSHPMRPRTTDTEVVRARSEWIQALHFLFGDSARRLPTETVLTQLDAALASH